MRSDNRAADELRPVTIEKGAQPHAAGSVLIRMGGTHVLCGVSVEEKVPPFLLGTGQGCDYRRIRDAALRNFETARRHIGLGIAWSKGPLIILVDGNQKPGIISALRGFASSIELR